MVNWTFSVQPQTIAEWSEKIAAYRIQASPLQYQLKGLHDTVTSWHMASAGHCIQCLD